MRDWPPLYWEIIIAVAVALALLAFLSRGGRPMFRPKSIGFGWTPNDWQGWVVVLCLVAAADAIVRLAIGR